MLRERDGKTVPVIYGYLDRGRPGIIAIDPEGRRFVNESNSYHDIVAALFERRISLGAAADAPFH
ncbi:FAD-binding protein, partial [Klebsiella aerogenes]|uniref:FAD-binding protein n=1 Tax=Klebsiella aerogenes TaxID=548 RepID=UPI001D12ECC3